MEEPIVWELGCILPLVKRSEKKKKKERKQEKRDARHKYIYR